MTTTKRRMIDPTMTSGLRRAFTAELRRQFSGLKLDIVRYFESDDFQRGLSVDSFSSWLQSRLQERLTGPRQERLWEMLVEESFRRGAGRAYDDVVPRDFSKTKSEWDQGSRAGFVRAIMGSGVQPLQLTGLTTNVFCPTGKGGGVDPTCGTTSSVQDPPVIDLEVYRGGGDKEGELVTYFTTRQDMAESYVEMYNDRYGAGGKLHKKSLSILSPARQDIIFSTALSIGFDEDDITSGTPATIFDQEIHGRDKVKKLVDTLRKSGHDGAILDDIAYGKNIQDKAYIKFSKPEPKNQIPQVRLKKGQRLTALPKDGIRPLGAGMYIYTSGGASYQLKKLGNGKYLVTGARLTTNALPFFSGARRAFDSVKLLAQRAWTEFVGGVQGLANGLARTFLDGRVRDAKPQAVAREMSKQVERARIQSTTVVSDSVVRAFNEGILVAAIPLGVTEIGVAVEWRVRRNPDGSIAKNVCRACRDLEGVVLRPSEAKGLFPRHPRCLPGDSLVSSVSRIAAVSKRWYDGDLVVIETASGRKLSCTPNHPILTDRGWIAAGLLDVGSYVVCDGRSQWKGIIDDNDKDVPTSIHEVSESFRSSRHVVSSEVPLAAPDFHGDGGSSKVAVIWSDSKLRSSGDSPHEKHLLKDHLSIGDVTSQVLSTRLRDLTESLNGSNASSRSCMSCGNLMTSLSRSHFSPSQGKSVAHSADRDVRKSKSSSDRRSINVIANSDRLLRLSGDISVDSVPERVNASSFTPEFSPQEIEDDVERDAQLAREILKGASGPVFLDNVLSVVTKKFSGHVYNLETEKGFYAAEGIITHNCQCSLVAITKAGKDSKTSRGSVVSAIQRSRRRYKSEKAREWASKVKISERRPKLTKNVLVERIDRMLTGNVFCPTGEGGGVDPTCSPSTSVRVEDWLDSLEESSVVRETHEPTTSEHISARESLSPSASRLIADAWDWEDNKPWNADKNRLPPGFEYGSYGGRGEETAHYEDGKIVLTDKFFHLYHEDTRRAVIYHELGHQLADTMVSDGTMFRLKDRGVFPKELNGQTTPHEILAEAYSLGNVDPDYLHKNAPNLWPYVRDRAVSLRMPYLSYKTPGRRPKLTKNVLVERIDRMLTNVFCPTGEGGGVDPTCSPSFSEGKSLAGEKGIQIKIEGGRIDVQFETKFSPRKHSVIDFVVDEDKRGRGLGDTLLKEALKRYEDLGGQVSSVPSLKLFYKNGFRNPDMSSSSLEEHLKEFRANGGSIYMAHKNEEGSPYTLNVFCPTGEGGGVDPTCSPNGKHIHTETSVLPPEEKNEDEAVVRESYIKDAKDMADSSYTQELVDRVKSRMAMHDERWSETHAQVMKLSDKEDTLREKHLKESAKLDKMMEANLKAKKAGKYEWPHSEEDIAKQAEKCDEALTKYFKHRNAMADKSWDVIRKSVSNEQRRFDGHYSIQEVKIHIDPNINDHIPSTQVVAEVEKVNARLSKCISQEYERRINHLTTVKAIPAGQTLRAHFSGSVHKGPGDHGEIFIGPFDKAGVIAHELGHSLEMDLNTHLAARGFLYHRVGKEVAVPTGSEHWEVGRTDRFSDAFESSASYVGKHYKTPDTEIISMGLQKLYEEPHFLAKKDPEYFKFMLGVLDGSFR